MICSEQASIPCPKLLRLLIPMNPRRDGVGTTKKKGPYELKEGWKTAENQCQLEMSPRLSAT